MLRKVIKIDENGNEVKDDQGNFLFEEIEILSDAEASANSELVQEAAEVATQVNTSDAESNEEASASNSKYEEIQGLKKQIEDLLNEIQDLKKQLNIEEPLKKVEELIQEDNSKIITSLGFDPKTKKIR